MGLAYQLVDGVLVFTTTGDVEYQDGLSILRSGFTAAQAADPARKWHLMFDIRQSTENRNAVQLRSIADLITAHKSILSGRCAVVATAPLHFGLARMFGAFLENNGMDAHVATSPPDAHAWLTEV
jgi:hypothetical protein